MTLSTLQSFSHHFLLNLGLSFVWLFKMQAHLSVMVPRFWTDRSEQTVGPDQTAPRGVYTVCHSVRIFWMHDSMVKDIITIVGY